MYWVVSSSKIVKAVFIAQKGVMRNFYCLISDRSSVMAYYARNALSKTTSNALFALFVVPLESGKVI